MNFLGKDRQELVSKAISNGKSQSTTHKYGFKIESFAKNKNGKTEINSQVSFARYGREGILANTSIIVT